MKKTVAHFIGISILAVCGTLPMDTRADKLSKEKQAWLNPKSISFTENKGQITDELGNKCPVVLFTARLDKIDAYLTNNAIHYVFNKLNNPSALEKINQLKNKPGFKQEDVMKAYADLKYTSYQLDMQLLGANKNPKIIKENPLEEYQNYFTLKNSNAIKNVRSYNKITYQDIYSNIDFVIYNKDGKLEYDFVVKPGGKVSDIKIAYNGNTNIKKNNNGEVIIETPLGNIKEGAPYTYQQVCSNKRVVKSAFSINKNQIGFNVSDYDKTQDLIIDPTLEWATYYGGDDMDIATGVTTDQEGNVYITGATYSRNNISYDQNGALKIYQKQYGVHGSMTGRNYNGWNAYVVKFNKNGRRVWATYYTSEEVDEIDYLKSEQDVELTPLEAKQNDICIANDICTDIKGDIYIGGEEKVLSTNATFQMPQIINLTPAYKHKFNFLDTKRFIQTAFVAKFNKDDGSLSWASNYGVYNTSAKAIAADANGDIYLTGHTDVAPDNDYNYIASKGAFQDKLAGGTDGFIAKFTGATGDIIWGTYYGGNDDDYIEDITIDPIGDIYAGGWTKSQNQISTTNNFNGGTTDAFLVKFDQNGQRICGSYYGGKGNDYVFGIATDNIGYAYMVGKTDSKNNISGSVIPQLWNVYQDTYGGGGSDGFLTAFNRSGNFLWGTYYGGKDEDVVTALTTDDKRNIYITGFTKSDDIPTSCIKSGYSGGSDVILSQFDWNGNRKWGVYYGGTADDLSDDISLDAFGSGNLYTTGWTSSLNGITGQNNNNIIHQSNYGGGIWDGFLLKFTPNENCGTNPLIRPDISFDTIKPGTSEVFVNINAKDNIYSQGVTVGWSVNDIVQPEKEWVNSSSTAVNQTTINIGSYKFEPNNTYLLKAWIIQMNDEDKSPSPDTAYLTFNNKEDNLPIQKLLSQQQQLIATEKVTISPNPFTQKATITLNNIQPNKKYTLVITDMYGRKIKQINNIAASSIEINRDNLTSGIYQCRILGGDNIIATNKIAVE